MVKALLLIDVQNEYGAEGRLPLPDFEPALVNIGRLLDHFRAIGAPVVHVQHVGFDSAAPFALNSAGWDLHPRVQPKPGEAVIPKYSPNAFRQSWLLAALQQAQAGELVVAGAMTQCCIDATVRGGLDLGFQITVAADACAAGPLDWDGETLPARQVHYTLLAALRLATPVLTTADLIT